MILASSFLTVLGNQASVTVLTKFGFANIIKTFNDDHAKITGIPRPDLGVTPARQASLPRVGFLSDEMTTTDDN